MAIFAATTLAALTLSVFAPAAPAQDAKPAVPALGVPSIEQRVDRFINQLEARRKEQGVVGAAVVVARGDRIVHTAGLGQRNLESNEPVTEDTVFALGSVTKQFTAMAVALTVNDGKLTFEDHPRRYVPNFRLRDAEADSKLNMIDLLAHRSGLARSDLAWILAPFTQDEMFELASRSLSVAKLRERFLYNNTMYALAGAVAARAQGVPYEHFMKDRLLAPLGMSSSTFTLAEFTATLNRAVGYTIAPKTGKSEVIKPLDLASIAPAGALNSSARDMGAWLRFLNSGGRVNGEEKIAPALFGRVFENHQAQNTEAYGLGFFLESKSNVLFAHHGGNVDGYTAMVGYVPARELSFALLTNQQHAQLGEIARSLFWDIVVSPELGSSTPAGANPPAVSAPKLESPVAVQRIEPERLVGLYFTVGFPQIDVRKAGGDLVAVVPGQPPFSLKEVGVNTFDLVGLNGHSLAFALFDPLPGRITALLRLPPSSPISNVPLLKADKLWLARAKEAYGGLGKDLIGNYRSDDQFATMEIVPYRQGIALLIVGQPLLPLKEIAPDRLHIEGLQETDQVHIRRSGSGGVIGMRLSQPPTVRLDLALAISTSADSAQEARRLLDHAVAAAGGAEVLDRISSMRAVGRTSASQHGLDGRFEDVIASNRQATRFELGAFGKKVFDMRVITGDQRFVVEMREGEQVAQTGIGLQASRFYAVPHPLFRWKERFATAMVAGETSINGEDAIIVELTPNEFAPVRLAISKNTFLIMREEKPTYSNDALQPISDTTEYSNYRSVNGVQMPFSASSQMPIGQIILSYDAITLSEPIDPKTFDDRSAR